MVICAYSVGCWKSGRTLLISERKNAASNVPTKDPRPAREARAAEDGGGDARERVVADDRRADLDLGREVEAGDRRHHRADDEREEDRCSPVDIPSRRDEVSSRPTARSAIPGRDRYSHRSARATRQTTAMNARGMNPRLVFNVVR